MNQTDTLTLQGHCLCGAVEYNVSGDLLGFYHCYCSRCRHSSGATHASNILLKNSAREWLQGENLVSSYRPPDAKFFTSTFCSRCGGRLPSFIGAHGVSAVPSGSVSSQPDIRPNAKIFTDDMLEWMIADENCASFPQQPN